MQNDILFDNIYIGHSVEDAEQLRKETFAIKRPIEDAEEEAARPKPADEPAAAAGELSFLDSALKTVREKIELFVFLAQQDPVHAIQQVPEVAGALGAVLVTLLLVVVGAVSASSSPAAAPAAKKGKQAEAASPSDSTAEAVSSAADTAKGAATKRTTRS